MFIFVSNYILEIKYQKNFIFSVHVSIHVRKYLIQNASDSSLNILLALHLSTSQTSV